MVQSMTFVQQLGYGILKIVLLNLMPELRPLFRSIERSVPEPNPAGEASPQNPTGAKIQSSLSTTGLHPG